MLTWPGKESPPSSGHMEDSVGVDLKGAKFLLIYRLLEDFRVGSSFCMFGRGLLVGGYISGVWFGVYFRSCLGAQGARPHIERG